MEDNANADRVPELEQVFMDQRQKQSSRKKYIPWRQKLLDPRWQRKRLEVMEAANFRCEACQDESTTLHIHHGFYDGRDPWDYPPESLWCLCCTCHELASVLQNDLKKLIGRLRLHDLDMLLEAVESVDWNSRPAGPMKLIQEDPKYPRKRK